MLSTNFVRHHPSLLLNMSAIFSRRVRQVFCAHTQVQCAFKKGLLLIAWAGFFFNRRWLHDIKITHVLYLFCENKLLLACACLKCQYTNRSAYWPRNWNWNWPIRNSENHPARRNQPCSRAHSTNTAQPTALVINRYIYFCPTEMNVGLFALGVSMMNS